MKLKYVPAYASKVTLFIVVFAHSAKALKFIKSYEWHLERSSDQRGEIAA